MTGTPPLLTPPSDPTGAASKFSFSNNQMPSSGRSWFTEKWFRLPAAVLVPALGLGAIMVLDDAPAPEPAPAEAIAFADDEDNSTESGSADVSEDATSAVTPGETPVVDDGSTQPLVGDTPATPTTAGPTTTTAPGDTPTTTASPATTAAPGETTTTTAAPATTTTAAPATTSAPTTIAEVQLILCGQVQIPYEDTSLTEAQTCAAFELSVLKNGTSGASASLYANIQALNAWNTAAQVGRTMCPIARTVDTMETFDARVQLAWTPLGLSTKAIFNNDAQQFAQFSRVSLQAFCSDQFQRLS